MGLSIGGWYRIAPAERRADSLLVGRLVLARLPADVNRFLLARNLLARLRHRDLSQVGQALAAETGLDYRPAGALPASTGAA